MQGVQMQQMYGVQQVAPTSALDYLATIDKVRVLQKVEIAEVVTGIDMRNQYSVQNEGGQPFLFCAEESGFCERLCCKEHRGFKVHITDGTGQEVLTLTREFKCCIWPCCGDPSMRYALNVSAQGTHLGTIRQAQQCCPFPPRLTIETASGQEIGHMQGPFCVCQGPCCYADVPFDVTSPGGATVSARVARNHAGCVQECFTKANNFSIDFFQGLDKNAKILILASTFLIDMMFFEKDK